MEVFEFICQPLYKLDVIDFYNYAFHGKFAIVGNSINV